MTFHSGHFKLDLRQTIKLVIYTLLLINYVLYIADDLRVASYTLRNGGTFLQWTTSFATTIDETAWFALLVLFELETYVLTDELQSRPALRWLFHGIRLVCYVLLMHTLYAFGTFYYDLLQITAIANATDLCQFADQDISFVRNLDYTDVSSTNCGSLSSDKQFHFTEPGLVVTDSSGLALEQNLARVDIIEAIVWMLILFTIEVMVWLQDRAITRRTLITCIKACKFALYGFLWWAAAYWAFLGHYYFAWDEAVWIVGFFAIEMNVAERQKDIEKNADASMEPALEQIA